jgi:DNA-binding CsgD family transcriptional regulator
MIEEALSIAELIGFVPAATRARAALRAGPERRRVAATTALSQREREVLALVARGHTAAEVAEQLVLSRRTVEKHLEHAYTKIGARNRAEGISWAIVNGLTQDP